MNIQITYRKSLITENATTASGKETRKQEKTLCLSHKIGSDSKASRFPEVSYIFIRVLEMFVVLFSSSV